MNWTLFIPLILVLRYRNCFILANSTQVVYFLKKQVSRVSPIFFAKKVFRWALTKTVYFVWTNSEMSSIKRVCNLFCSVSLFLHYHCSNSCIATRFGFAYSICVYWKIETGLFQLKCKLIYFAFSSILFHIILILIICLNWLSIA